MIEKLGERELTILSDYLQLWTRSLIELLENIRDTCPESSSIIAEIFYWRDITRVLDAVSQEIKQPYVEMVLQLMISTERPQFQSQVKSFQQQKDRVMKGVKEARWNNKHMKGLQ